MTKIQYEYFWSGLLFMQRRLRWKFKDPMLLEKVLEVAAGGWK